VLAGRGEQVGRNLRGITKLADETFQLKIKIHLSIYLQSHIKRMIMPPISVTMGPGMPPASVPDPVLSLRGRV